MIEIHAIKRSLGQIRHNPLRTLLTLLGVMFGVSSVVAMVSIGKGAHQEILRNIEAMGTTNVHIESRPVPEDQLDDTINQSAGLSRGDVIAIRRVLSNVTDSAYRASFPIHLSNLGGGGAELTVFGVSENLSELHNLEVAKGRDFLKLDHQNERRVIVIGSRIENEHLDGDAVGKQIQLNFSFFTVVGVLSNFKQDFQEAPVDPGIYESAVLMPFSTAESELAPVKIYSELDMVTLKTHTLEDTLPLKNGATAVLNVLHDGVEDFEVIAPEEILRQKQRTQGVLDIVLVSIAAISLLVGGIGVMNIMLANVMERISEIGLRRAVGARKKDIRNQFLFESTLICFLGGLIGIVLGLLISVFVSKIIGLEVAFAWESMAISFVISTSVGLVFGLMPAIRAANINPIQALRHE